MHSQQSPDGQQNSNSNSRKKDHPGFYFVILVFSRHDQEISHTIRTSTLLSTTLNMGIRDFTLEGDDGSSMLGETKKSTVQPCVYDESVPVYQPPVEIKQSMASS